MNNIQIPLTLGKETVETLQKVIGGLLIDATKNLDSNGNSFKNYMNKKEAAEYIGISYQTLKKFIGEGLPVVEVSGVQMIRKIDIDEFMESNRK
ncbi:helix-turn-helix domain-containing protein [Macrococcoides caseolyticum]|uniref:helix-turn-helix domain-containing protein n=1 Tax=Macrococcoides caseolyticum TaxID=69966 RepID=UPI00105D4746|nr:helix-turn-helix domain-containing protein [Macrococcus caseolyticus]TDM17086.1 DNA-binding protein [Macrococcus caseolyticus]